MKLNVQRWWVSRQQQDDDEYASNYPSSLKRQREAYAGIHKSGGKRKKVKR